MKLIFAETGEILEGIIEKVSDDELRKLKGSKDFTFDWSKEIGNEVYKIQIEESDDILGLISLIDMPKEFRIHINLIESSKENKGKNKKIKRIPGCLIGFTCRLAFDRGYDGFVSLVPKTTLIDHYQNAYGFAHAGQQMAVFMQSARALILKYIDDE